MKCPKCGIPLKKWYLIGGRTREECPACGYKDKIK